MDGAMGALEPVSGLGNFKGVMLCNRPADSMTSRPSGAEQQPFRSMTAAGHGDQIGLTPCRNYEQRTVKKRGPSAALRRHVQWLKDLQGEVREERMQAEADEQNDAERKLRTKAYGEKQREAVRHMMEQDRAAKRAEAAANAGAAKKKAPPSKPKWAMTEAEKDDFEEGEADQLINFAENLDYDKFVGDLDFRQALDALKDRAGKLQKEQDAFKDSLLNEFNAKVAEEDENASTSAGASPRRLEDGVEGMSVLGSEYSAASSSSSRGQDRARGFDGRAEWDASTSCADERPVIDKSVKEAAELVLESNPHLRGVHSKESLQRIIGRQREMQAAQGAHEEPVDLRGIMERDGPVVVPVLAVSSDTQQRLHKPVMASQLPYLFRCNQI